MAHTTTARGKLDEPKRRALHEFDEIDAKVLGFLLEVLRGADQLRLSFGMEFEAPSPECGACLAKDLIGWNARDLTRKEFVESTLGLLEPKALAFRIGVIVETRDEPLGEARSRLRRQLQNLGFEPSNRVSHRVDVTTAREIVPRSSSRDSALATSRNYPATVVIQF